MVQYKELYLRLLLIYGDIFCCLHVCVLIHFSHVQLYETSWTVASRLLCPWDSPGKNTGVGCHALLQGIFLTQELNRQLLQLLHCKRILYHWATREALLLLLDLISKAIYSVYHKFHLMSNSYKEKAMAPHSSTLAWKIPWTEEPGGL